MENRFFASIHNTSQVSWKLVHTLSLRINYEYFFFFYIKKLLNLSLTYISPSKNKNDWFNFVNYLKMYTDKTQ